MVGTPIANRTRVETEGLIGFFANTLLMRANLSGDPTFCEVLGRVRTTAMNAYAHQDLPFERLVEELQPERDHRRNPLFQVMFVFQNVPGRGIHPYGHPTPPGAEFEDGTGRASREPLSGLTVSPMEVNSETAKFDLTLYLSETGQGLTATWQYNTDLFDGARIARMAGNFQTLLEGIVVNPDSPLSELPLLSDAERHQLLVAWNQTETPYSHDPCFHHLFEKQVQLTPDAPAVRCGEEQLTYSELNKRANQLAWRLQGMGVGPETPVGICLTRSAGMVAALLGVMKAGGTYVPLDPAYPPERLAFVQEDARVAVLVTEERLLPILDLAFGISDHVSGQKPFRIENRKSSVPTVVCLESDPEMSAAESEQNPVSAATAANLAYVIYTSGSTGKPKGVMITHANLCHYVHAMHAALGIRADDCYLHTASFAFSSSIRQFAVPLACGATVVIAPTEEIRDPQALFEFIRQQRVSIIDIVPSYWRSCNQVLASLEPTSRADLLRNQLRLILSASEPLFSDVPKEWGLAIPARRPVDQHVRADRDGRHRDRLSHFFPRWRIREGRSYRSSDRDHASVRVGLFRATRTRRRLGRAVYRRRRPGAGVSQPTRADGGKVRAGSVQQDFRGASLPDRGCDALPARRKHRVLRSCRPADEAPRFPHRAGGDRGGRRTASSGAGKRRGDSKGHDGGETSGGLCGAELCCSEVQGFRVCRRALLNICDHPEREHLTRELRAYLKQKLPEYMVPSLIVELANTAANAQWKGRPGSALRPTPRTDHPERGYRGRG